MIIDQKGKIFGKISIIDVLVVLLIIALAFGAYYKFVLSDKDKEAARFDTIQYKVEIKDVRKQSVDALKVGQDVYDVKTDGPMGKITNKEVRPSAAYITKMDGSMVLAEKPDKYDIVLTISVPGVETDYGFLANGNREITRDSKQILETQLIVVETRVVDVKNIGSK